MNVVIQLNKAEKIILEVSTRKVSVCCSALDRLRVSVPLVTMETRDQGAERPPERAWRGPSGSGGKVPFSSAALVCGGSEERSHHHLCIRCSSSGDPLKAGSNKVCLWFLSQLQLTWSL